MFFLMEYFNLIRELKLPSRDFTFALDYNVCAGYVIKQTGKPSIFIGESGEGRFDRGQPFPFCLRMIRKERLQTVSSIFKVISDGLTKLNTNKTNKEYTMHGKENSHFYLTEYVFLICDSFFVSYLE